MQPFPEYKRRIYFLLFVILFLVLLPAVILYADGWRFKSGLGFVRTGGIYVEVPYADAEIFLNAESVGRSRFLQREFYIGDLAPSAYAVRVEGAGYRTWNRVLVVEPQLVTDAHAILLPEEIELTRLIVSGTASSTKTIPRTLYDSYLAAFAVPTASSTVPIDEERNVGLFLEKGDLIAKWTGNEGRPSSAFCVSPSLCVNEMSIKRIGGDATDATFFGGGVVYRTKEGGVYFTEIDIRPTAVSAQLYAASGADMRVIDGALIVQSDEILYEVEGL